MSWAAHDPEGWDEVCEAAIFAKMREPAFSGANLINWEAVADELHELRSESYWIFQALYDWARERIPEFEAEYLIGRGNG